MAYFPNGASGELFEEQCAQCKYGLEGCPIYMVQSMYNYDACNNKTASAILNALVDQQGRCTMFMMFKKDLAIDP